jgi:hypothetical protein
MSVITTFTHALGVTSMLDQTTVLDCITDENCDNICAAINDKVFALDVA